MAPSSIPRLIIACTRSNWMRSNSGPMWSPSCVGSPTCVSSAARLAISTAASKQLRSTSKRVGASQDWPVLYIHSATEAVTRSCKSQSANTRLGDLPPSSSVTRFTVSAASRVTAVPARVEPVKDIIWISQWRDIAEPTVGPSPCTRLNTPAGKPAS